MLSGNASDTDIRNVSQNLDNIIQHASTAEPPAQQTNDTEMRSASATPTASTPSSTTPAMAIRKLSTLHRESPAISPNTSVFFNEIDSVLSPSSQSILRMQQLYSPRPAYCASYGSNLSQIDSQSPFIASAHSNRRLHRAATMYPTTARQSSVGSDKASLSRSASVSSSVTNNSPALQFLTRFASNTFSASPSDGGFGSAGADNMGEEIGEYVIGKLIGYGGFSEVKEAITIGPFGEQETLAVKIVHKTNNNLPSRNPDIVMSDDALEKVQSEFDHEVTLWKTLDHPNILKLLNVHENDKATYCFTNKISGGTLFDLIRKTKRQGLRPRLAVNYAKQLASALLYLHETMKIVHRDVKPENCLIEEEAEGRTRVVLCDFGMSDYFDDQGTNSEMSTSDDEDDNDDFESGFHFGRKIGPAETSSILNQYHNDLVMSPQPSAASSRAISRQGSFMTSSGLLSSASASDQNIGSLPYASPELLRSAVPIFSPSIDIWAYGVLVYSMFRGELPWQHAFSPRLREMILGGVWKSEKFEAFIGDRMKMSSIEEDVSHSRRIAKQITALVKGCLETDVGKRFTIRQIVEHDWGF